MLGSIIVSLAGLYYKREELKAKANAVFTKKTPAPEPEPDPAPEPELIPRHRKHV